MSLRNMIFGEKMPDKSDPRYKERYEHEKATGSQFAEKMKLNALAMKIQAWANEHRIAFLAIVFGFTITLFAINVFGMVRAYNASRAHRGTAVEKVDSALQHRHDQLNNR